ncbi:hypothetical protein [Sodaliphilus sp.]|uniref:hypothetical protein n=1 Tax=Sodaliphilus sp. TaxID=2815818 RepID=UPI0038902DE0
MKCDYRTSILFVLFLSTLFCFASEPIRQKHWQAKLDVASYNSIDWEIECGINYFPIEYAGIGVSFSGLGDFGNTAKSFIHDGMVWETEDLHDAILFKCGAQLQSPVIWQKNDGSVRLRIKEDCGVTLPIPTNKNVKYTAVPNMSGIYVDPNVMYSKNNGATACFFHSRTSLVVELGDWSIWAGYTWSNLDVYSSVRNVKIDNVPLELPSKRQMHGVNIGAGYKF